MNKKIVSLTLVSSVTIIVILLMLGYIGNESDIEPIENHQDELEDIAEFQDDTNDEGNDTIVNESVELIENITIDLEDNLSSNSSYFFPFDPFGGAGGFGGFFEMPSEGDLGIKVTITYFEAEECPDEEGDVDPRFAISIFDAETEPNICLQGANSEIYEDQRIVNSSFSTTFNVDDNITYFKIIIVAMDWFYNSETEEWEPGDYFDLNSNSTSQETFISYIYFDTQKEDYRHITSSGDGDQWEEMDGTIQWNVETVEIEP